MVAQSATRADVGGSRVSPMNAHTRFLITSAVAGALALTSAIARADDPPAAPRHYAAGFAGGLTYGLGIAGRVYQGPWGGQITVLPYYSGGGGLFAGGLTGFYTLNQGRVGKLYVSLGSGAITRISTVVDGPTCDQAGVCVPPADPTPRRVMTGGFAVGPGLGMEFVFAENFLVSVELPVAFTFDASHGVALQSVLPIPNAALLYTF